MQEAEAEEHEEERKDSQAIGTSLCSMLVKYT
jgi:hypothetical protein